MLSAAVTGFLSALSLILAIGAQNAYVLRQSLTKTHILPVVLFCAVSDSTLIIAGVLGFSAVVDVFPALPDILAIGGACFLAVYGALRVRAALKGEYHMEISGQSPSLGKVLLTLAAVTWLNPHVYVDTLGLLGAISTKFEDTMAKFVFTAAAASASFTFFFALGYGGRFLAPIMQTARAWRVLDSAIAVVMFAIALSLLKSVGGH